MSKHVLLAIFAAMAVTTTLLTSQSISGFLECGNCKSLQIVRDSCRWNFIKYTPSAYETYWTENIATLQDVVCEESNKQTAEVNEWIKQSSSNDAPHDFPTRIFSQFTFQNECTGQVSSSSQVVPTRPCV